MKKIVIVLAVLTLFLAGCASQKSPDIVCNSPYMRNGADCCLDKNSNSICDTDEGEDPLFVEPDYAPSEEVPDVSAGVEYEPVYIPPPEYGEEEVPAEPVYQGTKTEVKSTPTKYIAPEVKLTGWKAENDHMSLEITKIVIDVVPITPKDLKSPDKEAYLKEMYLTIKNKDYNYLNPKFLFKIGDSKDPIIVTETLLCDKTDDIVMEGCIHALPETETMNIRMQMARQMPRLDLQKTIKLTLQNRRDEEDENILVIEKTDDILDIFGITYI